MAVQLDRIQVVTDWEAAVHHVVGDIPAAQLLGFRIGDLTLHTWDLATALGVDDGIPDDLAAVVFETWSPWRRSSARSGCSASGPSGTVGADAPVKIRLLDLSRTPPLIRRGCGWPRRTG